MIQKQSPEVCFKKRCLRNFTKFTGKHVCQSFFFNKVAGLRLTIKVNRPRACSLIKKRGSGTGVLSFKHMDTEIMILKIFFVSKNYKDNLSNVSTAIR